MQNIVEATDNYFLLINSILQKDFASLLAVFFLSLGRLLPIMVLAPFFASSQLPAPMKIMFSASLLFLLFPQILFSLQGTLALDASFIGLFLKEVLIGFALGFFVAIPFYIAQSSGSLIDHIRGSASLQVADPTTKTQTGPVGILYNYVLIAVFFAVGGPLLFIDALSSSFSLIPVDKFLSPLFFNLNIPFWKMILGMLTHLLRLALQLGAPSIVALLMAEMFLGIANRMAPQVQIVFLGISLKSYVGLALLAVAWFFILQQLGKESLIWLKALNLTIQATGTLP
ncbi:MAG: EscT/YscT/HrcT family type III secretion system export apparatus protein [Parachlamydiales bacterium]|jgi:type III secretion protein SpaR/YscT/HrcT